MRATWHGVNTILGQKNKKSNVYLGDNDPAEYVDQLNSFYNRFDCNDFSFSIGSIKEQIHREAANNQEGSVSVSEGEVTRTFRSLNERKASGPDSVKG